MKLSKKQVNSIRKMLRAHDSKEIQSTLGVSKQQVAAVKAHVTMGTYKGTFIKKVQAEKRPITVTITIT